MFMSLPVRLISFSHPKLSLRGSLFERFSYTVSSSFGDDLLLLGLSMVTRNKEIAGFLLSCLLRF